MNIANQSPIIGIYGVNQRGSGDMYYKGGNMLNTLQEIIADDEKWRSILRGLNEEFYHQTVSTRQVENYISQQVGVDLRPFFDQYLRETAIPVLEYYFADEKILHYRWTSCVSSFDMPVDIVMGEEKIRLQPNTSWQELRVKKPAAIQVDSDYYVGISKMR